MCSSSNQLGTHLKFSWSTTDGVSINIYICITHTNPWTSGTKSPNPKSGGKEIVNANVKTVKRQRVTSFLLMKLALVGSVMMMHRKMDKPINVYTSPIPWIKRLSITKTIKCPTTSVKHCMYCSTCLQKPLGIPVHYKPMVQKPNLLWCSQQFL